MPVLLPALVTAAYDGTPQLFPDGCLELAVEMAFGADLTADPDDWEWTELTCPHPSIPSQTISRLLATPITIKQGVAVGAATKATTTGTLHMLNLDGALTPMLATSEYWPYVDSGTPIRLRLKNQPDIIDTFTRTAETNGWGTSSSGDVWTPVTSTTEFSTTGTQGQMTFAAVNLSRRISVPRVMRDLDMTWDVGVNAVATGAAHTVQINTRLSGTGLYRIAPAIDFGLLGVVSLRVRRYFNNLTTSTTIASATVPALTYAAGTMIRVRAQVIGTTIRMRAWLASGAEPSTWHLDTTEATITGKNAAVAATDVLQIQTTVLNTSTATPPIVFTFDNISIGQAPSDRLEGFITDVRPQFTPMSDGTTWSTVLVDVGGVGSRLEKREAPAWSPLRRSTQLAATTPVAYWPLEDAEGSVTGASAFPGQPPMVVTGPAVFGFSQGTPEDVYQSRYGTKPLVSLAAGARIAAAVPISSVATEWAVSFVGEFYEPDVPASTEIRIAQWDTPGGTHGRWAFVATDTGYEVRAYNDLLGTTTVSAVDAVVYTGQILYTVEAFQSGGNISVRIFYNDGGGAAAVLIAGTLAAPSKLTFNPDQANTTASLTTRGLKFLIGHARVVNETSVKDSPYYTDPTTGLLVQARQAWYQETATSRIDRLADEERVPCTILGDVATTGYTQLNGQRDGSFTALVEQAAESESGMLVYERGFGYEVLPRTSRYNQAVALTIDLATYCRSGDTDQADVLVPQLESRAANYWTVKRYLGSEGTYAADVDYRARRGTIPEEVTIDALTDAVLPDHAAWRTHVNVDVTSAQYPATPIDLRANPDLIDDWLGCRVGSRIQRTNQPTIAGLETIDVLMVGYTETIAPRQWDVEVAGASAEPWQVGVYDDTCRYDSASTTLGADVSDSAISLSFSTADSGDLWSTTGVPYDVLISGERITVTSMGTASGGGPYVQTAAVTRGVGGFSKTLSAGDEIHIATPGRYGL